MNLFENNIQFEWDDNCELKPCLTTTSMLTLLEGTDGSKVYNDAFNHGLGCALMQHGRVVAYTSQ